MAESSHENLRRVFDLVMAAAPGDRGPLLDRECRDDAGLRQRIEAMVAAAEDERFLSEPTRGDADAAPIDDASAAVAATVAGPLRESPGTRIGGYKLLEQIGEGGFGSVWAAEQREPVRRRVALKIIKLGMDTKQVIARFEAERQALAMMDHPNIAKVLDAGATEAGRPYFVMELVKGVPIVEYCDTEKLDTKGRLDLFIKVCHAIQHAHHKGIIHRDIKPSNVLVTLHDGVPVPKVIDFGIAKATNQELTSKTLYTQHRQMIGTPAYMSPEQAEMSGLDIDTRSDIYALGVLLYELLTGTTPFANEELMSRGYAEMMRIIREVEPHKPSTRLSSLGETGTRTAQQRHLADVGKLGLILRGDLDWIVMKCLEKDRARRYETANGLAMDIRRHLEDEPVTAGPPSTAYRLRKFVKRNRAQVLAGGALAALLLLGVVGTSMGMVWAINEKNRADTEAMRASLSATAEAEQRRIAEANEQKAERELARATEIKRLITDMLQSIDPQAARGADTTLLRGILESAASRLRNGEVADELVAAELHHVVGQVKFAIALSAEAAPHVETAIEIRTRRLGVEDPATLASMNRLATIYTVLGRLAEAEQLLLQTLELRKQVLGPEHRDTLQTMVNLTAIYGHQRRLLECEQLCLELLDIQKRVLGESDRPTLVTMMNLGAIYTIQRRYAEAEVQTRRTLEILTRVMGPDSPDTLMQARNLGMLYRYMDQPRDGATVFETNLPIMRRVWSTQDPHLRTSIGALADCYLELGRADDARPLCLELLEILGPELERPDTSSGSLYAAARVLTREIDGVRNPARALEYARLACAKDEAAGHPGLMNSLDMLALAQHQTGDSAAAVETQRRALSLMGPNDPERGGYENRLAEYEAALTGKGGDPE